MELRKRLLNIKGGIQGLSLCAESGVGIFETAEQLEGVDGRLWAGYGFFCVGDGVLNGVNLGLQT